MKAQTREAAAHLPEIEEHEEHIKHMDRQIN